MNRKGRAILKPLLGFLVVSVFLTWLVNPYYLETRTNQVIDDAQNILGSQVPIESTTSACPTEDELIEDMEQNLETKLHQTHKLDPLDSSIGRLGYSISIENHSMGLRDTIQIDSECRMGSEEGENVEWYYCEGRPASHLYDIEKQVVEDGIVQETTELKITELVLDQEWNVQEASCEEK